MSEDTQGRSSETPGEATVYPPPMPQYIVEGGWRLLLAVASLDVRCGRGGSLGRVVRLVQYEQRARAAGVRNPSAVDDTIGGLVARVGMRRVTRAIRVGNRFLRGQEAQARQVGAA